MNRIKISENSKKALFFIYSLLLLIVSFVSSSVYASIFIFFVYFISVLLTFNKGFLSDPRILFVGFFFLYSTFYPFRVVLTGISLVEIDFYLLNNSVNYAFVGAITFVTVCNLFIDEKVASKKISLLHKKNKFLTSERIILFSLFAIVLIGLYEVITSGATSKRELTGNTGIIPQLAYFSSLMIIVCIALRITRINKKIYKDKVTLSLFAFFLFFLFATGERDTVFRVAIISLLVFFDKNGKGKSHIVLLLIFGAAIVVPMSQAFKAIFLVGELNLPSIGAETILNNEFISASRNLYVLQLYGVNHDLYFIYTDFVRAFVPTIFISDFDITSTNQWFHNVYRQEHGLSGSSGWGFGMIAQGFLIGGLPGIILLMGFYSSILTFFFNRKYKSVYSYVFYILMLITAIYCIRADLANFLSQVFKITGLMIVVAMVVHNLFKKNIFKTYLTSKV
ncbi:MAG: O-antigen polymerase [Candidatus Woykebacteria bacterium]